MQKNDEIPFVIMSCACDSLRKFLLSVLRTADPVDNSLSIIKVQGIRAETTDDTVLETLISGSVCLSATFFRRSVTQLSTDVLFVCAKSQVLGLTCPALLVDGKCVSVEISNEQLPVDLKPETLVDKMDLFTTGVFSDIGLFVASTPNPRTSHYCCSETPRSMLTFDGPRTPMLPSARWDEDRRTPLTDGVFTFSGTGRRPRFDRRPSVRATREEARTEDVQRTPAPIDREELLSPYIPANIGLSPASMIQGYLSESLCLPCNSLTHSMPKCPHGVFVCPNCLQPDHNGNKCPEKCRFCGSRHEGVSIMRCIKETAGKIRRHEALNFEIGTVPLFIRKQVGSLLQVSHLMFSSLPPATRDPTTSSGVLYGLTTSLQK